jgi:hypothetical protein
MAPPPKYKTEEERKEARKHARKRYYDKNAQLHMDRCKVYEKTLPGYLMRTYRNMKSRVTGIQKKKSHLYLGLEILPKEEFYEWANCSPMFLCLYHQYVASGFDLKKAPSVDRIDSSKGYTLDNMQWVSHSVNSSRGAKSQWKNR